MKILDGKSIIITGASSGIGRAVAKGLALQGAKVGLIARREEPLKKLADEIGASGGIAEYRLADVSDYNGLKAAIEEILQAIGPITGLINNAGISGSVPPKAFHEVPVAELENIVDVNLKGVMYGTHIILPHMIANREGVIVNTGSEVTAKYADDSLFLMHNYTATKYGVNGLTKALACDLKQNRKIVSINAVLPGWTESEMTDNPFTKAFLASQGIQVVPAEKIVPFYTYYFSKEGKKLSGTLLMTTIALKAIEAGNALPPDERDWDAIMRMISPECHPNDLVELGQCKRMIMALLKEPSAP